MNLFTRLSGNSTTRPITLDAERERLLRQKVGLWCAFELLLTTCFLWCFAALAQWFAWNTLFNTLQATGTVSLLMMVSVCFVPTMVSRRVQVFLLAALCFSVLCVVLQTMDSAGIVLRSGLQYATVAFSALCLAEFAHQRCKKRLQ